MLVVVQNYFKMDFYKIVCFMLLMCYFNIVSSKRSVTILLDSTESMKDEISIIKRNIGPVLEHMESSGHVDNFVLLTFSDPDIGTPINASTANELKDYINRVTVKGGGECPENSLGALIKGLEVSQAESYIFVFTDAYAEDQSKVSIVRDLCERTGSRIIIFLNGYCVSTQVGASDDAYYSVAKACKGAFSRMYMSNFRQAFLLMREITKTEWSEIVTNDVFRGYAEVSVTVDPFTSEFLVAVYGNFPSVRVTNKHGRSVFYEKIVETSHFTVLRLIAQDFEYKLLTRSQGTTSMTFYKKFNKPFLFGFSPIMPNSLKETTLLPLPVRSTTLVVPAIQESLEINSVQLLIYRGDNKRVENLEKNDRGTFTTTVSFGSNDSFQILIKGVDSVSYMDFTSSTRILKPQNQLIDNTITEPSVEILAENIVRESGDEVRIPCKVAGYPKPNMVWEDDGGRQLPSNEILLDFQSVHIVYGTVTNLTRNMTIYCKARNTEGEVTESTDVYVKRTNYIDEIQMPADIRINYEEEGKLYCRVNANPDPKIKWYHNDTEIEEYTNTRLKLEEDNSVLVIKSMDLDDAGKYKCIVATKFETREYAANVEIAGLEAPDVYVTTTEMYTKLEDNTRLECSIIRGKPTPVITWSFKPIHSDYFSALPYDVTANATILEISSLTNAHAGTYKCIADNIMGQDSKEIVVHVQSPPVITFISESQQRTEGDFVELICKVEADPAARVRWEMTQDDTIMPFDERHTTDESYTHSFTALWKDSGNYHCIAENSVGRAEKTLRVNVLVPPHIVRPAKDTVTIRTGDSFPLICNVDYGYPVPVTKWEFIGLESTPVLLSSGNSTNYFNLSNVSEKNQGSYKCRADNVAGFDHIEIQLIVL